MKKIVLLILMMLPVAVLAQVRWSGEPGEKVVGPFKVFQVVSDTKALAFEKSDYGYNGMLCLIYHTPDVLFFEDAIVRASRKKEFRIVGTYTYETRNGYQKTIPVIEMMDKQKKTKKKEKTASCPTTPH